MITDEQKPQLKEFYGASVDFSRVRFKESRIVSGGSPWACGNVIRVPKPKSEADVLADTSDLIHECGNVRPHQRGQLVFLSALAEQLMAAVISSFDPAMAAQAG